MAELTLSGEQVGMTLLLGTSGAFIAGVIARLSVVGTPAFPPEAWAVVGGLAGGAAGIFIGPMIIDEGAKLAERMR